MNTEEKATQRDCPSTRDMMTEEDFDRMIEKGLSQAKAGQGLPLDVAFDRIGRNI